MAALVENQVIFWRKRGNQGPWFRARVAVIYVKQEIIGLRAIDGLTSITNYVSEDEIEWR